MVDNYADEDIVAVVEDTSILDMVEPKDYSSVDPHFFKPADKAESQFHEGDWVVDSQGKLTKRINSQNYENYNKHERLPTMDEKKSSEAHRWLLCLCRQSTVTRRGEETCFLCRRERLQDRRRYTRRRSCKIVRPVIMAKKLSEMTPFERVNRERRIVDGLSKQSLL